MTLLLGGPGSGKSTLLKVLSGRLKSKNFEVGSCWLTVSKGNATTHPCRPLHRHLGCVISVCRQQYVLTVVWWKHPRRVAAS